MPSQVLSCNASEADLLHGRDLAQADVDGLHSAVDAANLLRHGTEPGLCGALQLL